MTLTNSCLSIRQPNDRMLQVGETTTSRIVKSELQEADTFGFTVMDLKNAGFTMLGFNKYDKYGRNHYLTFSDKGGTILYTSKGDK